MFKCNSLFLVACLTSGLSTAALATEKVKVITSFSVLGDIVQEIGGDKIALTTLVTENGDTHAFKPSPKDVRGVSKADLIVINGLGFEGWLPRLIEASHFDGMQVIASNGIKALDGHDEHKDHDADHDEYKDHDADHDGHKDHDADHDGHKDHDADHDGHKDHDTDHDGHKDHDADHDEHKDHDDEAKDHDEHKDHDEAKDHDEHKDHDGIDPHAWHSIRSIQIYAANIRKGLTKVDPKNSTYYTANFNAYLLKLKALDNDIQMMFNTVPVIQRKVIVPHNAFAYFARDYGIDFHALQGTSTDSEASAADIAAVIDQIRDNNIKAIFIENVTDNRLIKQISEDTKVTVAGKLYSDALSGKNEQASTYLQMMEYNATTIYNAIK